NCFQRSPTPFVEQPQLRSRGALEMRRDTSIFDRLHFSQRPDTRDAYRHEHVELYRLPVVPSLFGKRNGSRIRIARTIEQVSHDLVLVEERIAFVEQERSPLLVHRSGERTRRQTHEEPTGSHKPAKYLEERRFAAPRRGRNDPQIRIRLGDRLEYPSEQDPKRNDQRSGF